MAIVFIIHNGCCQSVVSECRLWAISFGEEIPFALCVYFVRKYWKSRTFERGHFSVTANVFMRERFVRTRNYVRY